MLRCRKFLLALAVMIAVPGMAMAQTTDSKPPEPEQTFVGTRWDQALQEIWSGTSGKEALNSAKEDIDAHMKDVGLLK